MYIYKKRAQNMHRTEAAKRVGLSGICIAGRAWVDVFYCVLRKYRIASQNFFMAEVLCYLIHEAIP